MFASVLSKRPFYILFTSFWGPSAKVAKSPKNVLFMSFWVFVAFSLIKACFRGSYFCRTIGSRGAPPWVPRGSSGLGFLACLDVWTFRRMDVWTYGRLDVWTFRRMDV